MKITTLGGCAGESFVGILGFSVMHIPRNCGIKKIRFLCIDTLSICGSRMWDNLSGGSDAFQPLACNSRDRDGICRWMLLQHR